MSSDKSTPRFLGAAFLLQAIASLVSGLFLLQPLTESGNVSAIMQAFAANVVQARASIVGEMITAIGIVMLGALLYLTLKREDERIALVAMGLYLVEATILVVSRIPVFLLLLVSQEAGTAADPAYLQTLGRLFYESQDFGYSLHMVPFALGATLFYYLFFKSRLIPRWLSIWGLIAAPAALVGMVFVLFGFTVPIIVFLPNLPFELTIGVWLLVRGTPESSNTR